MSTEARTEDQRTDDERIRQLASTVLEEVASSLDDEQQRAVWEEVFQRAAAEFDRSFCRASTSPDRYDAAQLGDCVRLCERSGRHSDILLWLEAAGNLQKCEPSASRISPVKSSYSNIWAEVTDPAQGEKLRFMIYCRNAAMHSTPPSNVGWVRLIKRLRIALRHRPSVRTPA